LQKYGLAQTLFLKKCRVAVKIKMEDFACITANKKDLPYDKSFFQTNTTVKHSNNQFLKHWLHGS
jgi:hypothetical protein